MCSRSQAHKRGAVAVICGDESVVTWSDAVFGADSVVTGSAAECPVDLKPIIALLLLFVAIDRS